MEKLIYDYLMLNCVGYENRIKAKDLMKKSTWIDPGRERRKEKRGKNRVSPLFLPLTEAASC